MKDNILVQAYLRLLEILFGKKIFQHFFESCKAMQIKENKFTSIYTSDGLSHLELSYVAITIVFMKNQVNCLSNECKDNIKRTKMVKSKCVAFFPHFMEKLMSC